MIDAGLRPTDPVRWYWAYVAEQNKRQREQGQQSPDADGDIEVLGNGA